MWKLPETVGCILLLGALIAVTAENGLGVTEMSTFVAAPGGVVLYMEINIKKRSEIIYSSDDYVMRVTDGEKTEVMTGKPGTAGYREQISPYAEFTQMTSFTQKDNIIYIADRGNNCLREFDRMTTQTSVFMGTCGHAGFAEGENPLFFNPFTLIPDPTNPDRLFLTDSGNRAIRAISISNRTARILIRTTQDLINPVGLAMDETNRYLYVTSSAAIKKYDMQEGYLTTVAGSGRSKHQDGSLDEATFQNPYSLLVVEGQVYATDKQNDVIRIVDEERESVRSICDAVPDQPRECELSSPRSLLYDDGFLYVGHDGAIVKLRTEKVQTTTNEAITDSLSSATNRTVLGSSTDIMRSNSSNSNSTDEQPRTAISASTGTLHGLDWIVSEWCTVLLCWVIPRWTR